jgi:hypothetical protein
MRQTIQENHPAESPAPGSGLSKIRPAIYSLIVASAIALTFAYSLRTDGIFGCPADGYGSERYLAYCNTTAYGDYDHGAFWFELEPEAEKSLVKADVLFLGSSRMQFAFSTAATNEWFASLRVPFYLLGFSHTENMTFIGPLLDKLEPQAKVYVINVDHFFHDRVTPPVADIHQLADAEKRYRAKSLWQKLHQPLCTTIPLLCGNQLAFYRRVQNGDWVLHGTGGVEAAPVSDGPALETERWPEYFELAKSFIDKIPVDNRCVLLTIAPYESTGRLEASAIADSLGIELISPKLPNLNTFDGSHLDQESAERWSQAFIDSAGPRIRECLSASAGAPN